MAEKKHAGEPEKLNFYLTESRTRSIAKKYFDKADNKNPENPWYISKSEPEMDISILETKITSSIIAPKTGKRKPGRKPAWLLETLENVEEGERDYSIEDILAEESRGDSILVNVSGKKDQETIQKYYRRNRKYNGTNQFGSPISEETFELMETIDDETLKITRNYLTGALKKNSQRL